MKVQDVFDQLSYGEFSQLSIGGAPAGVLDESNYLNVLGHMNLALTALFTRFSLKTKSLTFPIQADSDTYQFNVFDLLKIEQVLTDDDIEIPLNDSTHKYSCTTPTLRTLKVPQAILDQGSDLPDELKTTNLKVSYRANHPKVEATYGHDILIRAEIELPESHLLALLYFIASRVHNPIGMSNEFHAGNSYAAKYEMECQRLEGTNLQIDQGGTNTKLTRNGWA